MEHGAGGPGAERAPAELEDLRSSERGGYESSLVRRGGGRSLVAAGLASLVALLGGLLWLGQVAPSGVPLVPSRATAAPTAPPPAPTTPVRPAPSPGLEGVGEASGVPYPTADLPAEAVRSVPLPDGLLPIAQPVADASRVLFLGRDETAGVTGLYLVDVLTGELGTLAAVSGPGDGLRSPQLRGDRVVWLETHCASPNPLFVRPSCRSAIDWTVVELDLATGDRWDVARGQSSRTADVPPGSLLDRPAVPVVALDGDHVAYSEEAPPTADRPDAWQVVVRWLADRSIVRTVPAAGPVRSLALTGSTVAFDEATAGSSRLVVAAAGRMTPVVLGSDVVGVVAAGDRIGWASQGRGWLAVWEAGLPGGPPPGAVTELTLDAIAPPTLTTSLLAWPDIHGLLGVTDLATRRTVGFRPAGRPLAALVSDGWLAWLSATATGDLAVSGLPLAALPWPRPSLAGLQVSDAAGLPVAAPGRPVGPGG